jgi:2'-hydroxyisoflavone reductase
MFMKLLVLGGTVFLGRHITASALTRGHEVTLFNRGQSAPDLFPNVETLTGNRDGNLDALKGRKWDAVIDTSGYVPRIVRQSAELLADHVETYTFISSISVYMQFTNPGMDESADVAKLDDEKTEIVDGESYGALKALCEKTIEDVLPGRTLNIRPGLIVGPYDPTDRFTYWPVRMARGGEVLAPGNPKSPVQFIDARDLADWIVKMTEARHVGVYNATGPDDVLTMEELLQTAKATLQSDAQLNWVDEDFLVGNGVQPWIELPLWIPESDNMSGFQKIDVSKAIKDGLTFRSLEETIRDTLEWAKTRTNHQWKAAMTADKERELLAKWNS